MINFARGAGAVLATTLVLSGCGSPAPEGAVGNTASTTASSTQSTSPGEGGEATSQYLKSLVGMSAEAALAQVADDGWRSALVKPGGAVPADYDAKRIILILDAADLVTSASNS